MKNTIQRNVFNTEQLEIVTNAITLAEEKTMDFYKFSQHQWSRIKYDIKTLKDLLEFEILDGPFAQVARYIGRPKGKQLGSTSFDFYKICLQDHTIIDTLKKKGGVKLFPFITYIVTHELVHIVRFNKFLQGFDATEQEKLLEEKRVHSRTHDILNKLKISGLEDIFELSRQWQSGFDDVLNTNKNRLPA